jgi:hypothetical protein
MLGEAPIEIERAADVQRAVGAAEHVHERHSGTVIVRDGYGGDNPQEPRFDSLLAQRPGRGRAHYQLG